MTPAEGLPPSAPPVKVYSVVKSGAVDVGSAPACSGRPGLSAPQHALEKLPCKRLLMLGLLCGAFSSNGMSL